MEKCGAGRYGKIHLRTMSLYESGDSTGKISLEDLCNNKFKGKATGEVDLRNLARCLSFAKGIKKYSKIKQIYNSCYKW